MFQKLQLLLLNKKQSLAATFSWRDYSQCKNELRIETDLKLHDEPTTGFRGGGSNQLPASWQTFTVRMRSRNEKRRERIETSMKSRVRDTCDKLIRNESRKRERKKKTFLQTIRFPFKKQIHVVRSVPSPFVTFLINVEYVTVSRPSTSARVSILPKFLFVITMREGRRETRFCQQLTQHCRSRENILFSYRCV